MKVTASCLSVPREGEQENGDAGYIRHWEGGSMLAVIDALGHGVQAAAASATATAYLGTVTQGQGLRGIIEGLHERLHKTRGAAAMVLLLEPGRLQGCGVGNVELRAYKARVPAILSPGVLGASLARLHIFETKLEANLSQTIRLVMFSDGISNRFDDDASKGLPVEETCRVIMDRHRRSHDDATVLVTDIEVLQ